MEKICDLCKKYCNENVHGIYIYDANHKDRIELTGHESCVEGVYTKVKLIEKALPLDKVIEYLGIEVK
ncbi:hypothetical protein [Metabacillus arenae]|uniref:Uncharacterized protein n=1 Tax=Metabacillus arenae TaxID=2771434 RepID=A0A926NFI8_9BACI|nr:hypothetical protein [Metabacillus arenae]MBD1379073.1 hypothetical protein [Metabacillus arenae]